MKIIDGSDLGDYNSCNDLDLRWKMVLEALDYETKGKRILELGCGATGGNIESYRYGKKYHPDLGRSIYSTRGETGLEYIGVDSGDISREPFPHKRINLLREQSLTKEFQEGYFDIAIAFMLFNSPELEIMIRGKDCRNASYRSGKRLADSILPQLEKIVKPEGIFLWWGGDDRIFRQNTPDSRHPLLKWFLAD